MTYNLDFALFYAYSLALLGFVLFWLAPKLVRLVLSGLHTARTAEAQQAPHLESYTEETRFDAFTRL